MKLRTSLVAAATAVSMITTGIATPAFAAETTDTTDTGTVTGPTPAPENPTEKTGNEDKDPTEETSGSSAEWDAMDHNEKLVTVKNWLGIATAVIGVLSAAFAFAAKYLPLPAAK